MKLSGHEIAKLLDGEKDDALVLQLIRDLLASRTQAIEFKKDGAVPKRVLLTLREALGVLDEAIKGVSVASALPGDEPLSFEQLLIESLNHEFKVTLGKKPS